MCIRDRLEAGADAGAAGQAAAAGFRQVSEQGHHQQPGRTASAEEHPGDAAAGGDSFRDQEMCIRDRICGGLGLVLENRTVFNGNYQIRDGIHQLLLSLIHICRRMSSA